jgi:energy-coupling factor transporter ATP-binding protein EcfA2
MQTMDNPRGSTWRKWDLHLHSPRSYLNNKFPKNADGTPNWEPYLEAIENAGEVGVIGVTDYFSVAGYRQLRQFKANGRLANVQNLMPNIELRIDNFVKDKRINYHVIFSDELEPDFIEEQFLNKLDFLYEAHPQETQYRRSVSEANLKELGQKLKQEEASFSDTEIIVGASNAVVQLPQVVDILTKDKRFKGKYLLVVAEELWADIPWRGQDHHTRKNLLQQSDMIFSSNPKTVQWCLGKEPYTEGHESFLKEFKTLKPSIHGSDAHELNEILKPCAKRGVRGHTCTGADCEMRFCWIKADPTFEGLKQLLYEPEDRVTISPIDPTTKKSGLSLENIEITRSKVDPNLKVQETSTPLNGDLIAVTGAKGSGKTAFVDLIANCYMDRKHSADRNSFVKRICSAGPVSLPITLKYLNGKEFSKDVLEDSFVDFADITYIAQAELEDYIFKHGGLTSQINDVVFSSKAIKDSQLEFEFNSIREDKTFLKERVKKMNEKIVELDGVTNPTKAGELVTFDKKANENLKDKKDRLAALEKTLSAETIAKAKSKQEEVQRLKLDKANYEKTLSSLRELGDKVEYELSTVNNAIKAINISLETFKIEDKIPEIPIDTPTYQPIFITVSKQIHTKLSDTIKRLKDSQEVVEKQETTTRSHALLSQEIKDIEQSVKDNTAKQAALNSSKTELTELIQRRRQAFKDLLAASLTQREKYIQITTAFSGTKDKVLVDVEFSARIVFDQDKLIKLAEEIFDLRMVNTEDHEESDIHALLEAYRKLTEGKTADIDRVIAETTAIEAKLRAKLKRSPNVNLFSLYRFMFGEYFSVTAQAKYKSVNIDKLSLGQKATVLIKVYLAQGEHPIIIDSHDDHLDNAFIMDELVPALREAKKTRQVIIVSNNGNVVVNSDADQVVIAHKADNEIKYTAGSLENKDIRTEALKVLEGGHDAFKKRQNKYRIF